MSVNFPLKLGPYVNFGPSMSYSESWFKIYKTDQSDSLITRIDTVSPNAIIRVPGDYYVTHVDTLKGVNTNRLYRSYIYRAGASLSTTAYGTVYPNVFGLAGLRQVLTPSVSYGFTPSINRYPAERGYVGAGGFGSLKTSSSVSLGLGQIYQAKIKKGEAEKNLELFSLSSAVSYDFQNPQHPLSDIGTSFQSQVLPKISLSGSMVHTLYKPGTDTLTLSHPRLSSFNLLTSITITGGRFLFDEPAGIKRGADSASQTGSQKASAPAQAGWTLRVDYSFNQSGFGPDFRKSSFLQLGLQFSLTPTTTVSYTQSFDPVQGRTINNQVSIVKHLHCWTGEFSWVPVGSNRGYGFRLYVTAIPAIKIDNSNTLVSSSIFQN